MNPISAFVYSSPLYLAVYVILYASMSHSVRSLTITSTVLPSCSSCMNDVSCFPNWESMYATTMFVLDDDFLEFAYCINSDANMQIY